MSKVKAEIYQCDCCDEKFFEREDVFVLEGELTDGDGEVVLQSSMLCHRCFLEKTFVAIDSLDPIIELSESVQDAMHATEDDEAEGENNDYDFDEDEEI